MNFEKGRWDVTDIASQLRSMRNQCLAYDNDIRQSFDIKKDLYQIKFLVDHYIKEIPEYHGEKDWLDNQEKKRLVQLLKME